MAIQSRLAKRGTNLSFPVHSDPDGDLLPSGDVLFRMEIDKSRDYVGEQTFEVEPALVVLDSSGGISRHWSWADVTGIGEAELDRDVEYLDPGQVLITKQEGGISSADNQDKDTWLVNIRVDAVSVLPALLEGLPFQQAEVESREETSRHFYASLEDLGGAMKAGQSAVQEAECGS